MLVLNMISKRYCNELEKVVSAASTQTDWSSAISSQEAYDISPFPKPETFTCQFVECVGRTFGRQIDLTRHTKTVHTRERYNCTVSGCNNNRGKGYCRADKVQEHQQKHHADLGFRKKDRKRPNKGGNLVSRGWGRKTYTSISCSIAAEFISISDCSILHKFFYTLQCNYHTPEAITSMISFCEM